MPYSLGESLKRKNLAPSSFLLPLLSSSFLPLPILVPVPFFSFFFFFFSLFFVFCFSDQSNCSSHPFAYVALPPSASIVLHCSLPFQNRLGFRSSLLNWFRLAKRWRTILPGSSAAHQHKTTLSHLPYTDQCASPPSPQLL